MPAENRFFVHHTRPYIYSEVRRRFMNIHVVPDVHPNMCCMMTKQCSTAYTVLLHNTARGTRGGHLFFLQAPPTHRTMPCRYLGAFCITFAQRPTGRIKIYIRVSIFRRPVPLEEAEASEYYLSVVGEKYLLCKLILRSPPQTKEACLPPSPAHRQEDLALSPLSLCHICQQLVYIIRTWYVQHSSRMPLVPTPFTLAVSYCLFVTPTTAVVVQYCNFC